MVTLKTTEIRYALANDSERLYEFLDVLTMKHDFVSVTSIGKTGERGNVYVGGMRAVDLISPSVLLRFICDYAEFYSAGKRMYGINMQYLWEHRTIHVIPMLNPDGYTIRRKGADKCIMCDRLKNLNVRDGHEPNDFSEWKYNACALTDISRNLSVSVTESENIRLSAIRSPPHNLCLSCEIGQCRFCGACDVCNFCCAMTHRPCELLHIFHTFRQKISILII